MSLLDLGVAELLRRLQSRELSAEALTRECLARIAEREPIVHAFAYLDADYALTQARALDAGAVRGPLHGLPIGVKDIFDTYDMPTAYGSPIYAGHRPAADAAIVAIARQMGALIIGKTVTTEFATFPPGPSANPRKPTHTPGGSSSGSACAVTDGMIPFAFGTQTTGSIVRPASFCGCVGYKPSFGLLPRIGVKAISECLDTVGGFAANVADVALVSEILSAHPLAIRQPLRAPLLGLCRTPQWPHAQAETKALWRREAQRLVQAGAQVREIELPRQFDALADAQSTIWNYEMARCLAHEHYQHAQRLREPLRSQLVSGFAVPLNDYMAARDLATRCRAQLPDVLGEFDALIVPSTPGVAPAGLEATGEPIFNRMWSLLHTPAVHVPTALDGQGLSLGLQIIGRIGADARTLAAAHWVERNLPLAALA